MNKGALCLIGREFNIGRHGNEYTDTNCRKNMSPATIGCSITFRVRAISELKRDMTKFNANR